MAASLIILERVLTHAGKFAGQLTLYQVLMFVLTVVAMLVFAVLSPFIMGPGYTVPRIEVPLSPGEGSSQHIPYACKPCLCLSLPAMGISDV